MTVTTLEALDYPTSLSLRQPSGRLEPFQRDKLFVSVYESLRHRKTALEDATALTEHVLSRLSDCMQEKAIDQKQLTKLVSETLRRFDTVAGTYYAAYHPL
jgi:transcriptional regulator NrdR family protein